MVEMVPVHSSNLTAIGYDAEAKTLHVTFRGGARYHYIGVPADLHTQLMQSASKGAFVHTHIKGKFPHKRIEEEKPSGG